MSHLYVIINQIILSISAYRTCKHAYRLKSKWAYDLMYKHSGNTESSCHVKGQIPTEPRNTPTPKAVVSVITDCHYNPGLCDKLRAILSIYTLCKKKRIPFQIYWYFPFDLKEYLSPNRYKWDMSENEMKWDSNATYFEVDRKPLLFQKTIDRRCVNYAIRRFFNHKPECTQLHIYSNAIFGTRHFKKSFDELFKPSPRLQDELDGHLKTIGGGYVSVSLRFMELLGDFKDQEAVSQSLPEDEQEALIERCMEQLKRIIHREAKGRRVFVASDSRKFLDRAATLPEVYTVPGDIVHVRYRGSEEAYMKTFVDLLLLRGADKRFLLKTGKMYNSGFPKFASWIGNHKFKLIEF